MEQTINMKEIKHPNAILRMLRQEDDPNPDYIKKIFATEFYARPDNYSRKKEIMQRYEKYVSLINGSVLNHLKVKKADRDNQKKLGEVVSGADEYDMFRFVNSFLYNDIKLKYNESAMLSSLTENQFNCFTASVLVWDAMRRIGKETQGVLTQNSNFLTHIFLAGDSIALDVTTNQVFSKHKIPRMYKGNKIEIIDVEKNIIGMAYCQAASLLDIPQGNPRLDAKRRKTLAEISLKHVLPSTISTCAKLNLIFATLYPNVVQRIRNNGDK